MGALTVVFPGALAAVQDQGRHGLRRVGVPRAGALAPDWLRFANVLAGNLPDTPAIEFFGGGLVLRAEDEPLRLGLAGPFAAVREGASGREVLSGWRSVTLAPGERLRCGAIEGARLGYIAVAGLRAASMLGSASTYARAGFGRPLLVGDTLAAGAAPTAPDCRLAAPPALPGGRAAAIVRVVPGPQSDHFPASSLAAFFAGDYRVTAESDRMGLRLAGAMLAHCADKGAEIASDATVPGSIQVPGAGQPIVLLNDGQTAGGYPKIATVISADLPILAVLPPGAAVRFEPVDVAAAEAAARARREESLACMAALLPLAACGEVDLVALYDDNLLSGMVDALQAEE